MNSAILQVIDFGGHEVRACSDALRGGVWLAADDLNRFGLPWKWQEWIDVSPSESLVVRVEAEDDQTLLVTGRLAALVSAANGRSDVAAFALAVDMSAACQREASPSVLEAALSVGLHHGPSRTKHFVYFAKSGGLIKIGTSTRVSQRLAEICPGRAPARLLGVQYGSLKEERELHGRFSDHRVSGEWFRPAPEILEYIALNTRKEIV